MKKIGTLIIGIIIGIGITLSPQIYGAGASLLGKDVDKQMDVKLNDKIIGQAAVIEGTSYIPVRAFANEYQLDVAVTSTTISLKSLTGEENAKEAKMQQDAAEKATNEINLKNSKVNDLKKKIESSKAVIAGSQKTITDWTARRKVYEEKLKSATDSQNQMAINDFTNMVKLCDETINKAKADLETANKELPDLEAQLAELQ